MSTFPTQAKKYIQSLIKPLLADGLQGTISTSVQDGQLDVVVPVSELDLRRLEPHQWALSALLNTLAQTNAKDLPEGVLSDGVAVRLTPPASKGGAKAQATAPQQLSYLPSELGHMPLARALELLSQQHRTRSPAAQFTLQVTDYGYIRDNTILKVEGVFAPPDGQVPQLYDNVTIEYDSTTMTGVIVDYVTNRHNGLYLELKRPRLLTFDPLKEPQKVRAP